MEKLHYSNHLSDDSTHKEVMALMASTFTWLTDNMGDAGPAAEYDSRIADEEQLESDRVLLYGKIAELIGDLKFSVTHVTWAEGPGYEVMACISHLRNAYVTHYRHDLVICFHDPLQALQFKLAIE
jgi:hypothetical protein